MFGTLFRVLFGFIIACLVAGVAVVAFVITPADIATLPAELRWERLGSAGMLSLLAATHAAIFAFPVALIAIAIGEWLSIRTWIYYVLVGIAIANGLNVTSVKIIFIFAFLMLANPTATHAMIRAAKNSGEALWKRDSKS